jgi:hypothetical protein
VNKVPFNEGTGPTHQSLETWQPIDLGTALQLFKHREDHRIGTPVKKRHRYGDISSFARASTSGELDE